MHDRRTSSAQFLSFSHFFLVNSGRMTGNKQRRFHIFSCCSWFLVYYSRRGISQSNPIVIVLCHKFPEEETLRPSSTQVANLRPRIKPATLRIQHCIQSFPLHRTPLQAYSSHLIRCRIRHLIYEYVPQFYGALVFCVVVAESNTGVSPLHSIITCA